MKVITQADLNEQAARCAAVLKNLPDTYNIYGIAREAGVHNTTMQNIRRGLPTNPRKVAQVMTILDQLNLLHDVPQ